MAAIPAMTLRTALSRSHCHLKNAQMLQFGILGVTSNCHQIRTRSNKQKGAQYKLQPDWFVDKKSRVRDEGLTRGNEEFVKEVIRNTYRLGDHMLKEGSEEQQDYHKRTHRCGVIAIKIGVIPQWTKDGHKFMTTLLQVIDNHVIGYTPPEEFVKTAGWKPWWGKRFGSIVVGAMSCDPRQYTRAYINLFSQAGVPPKKLLTRFLITPNAAIQPGTPLSVMHFRVGDYVDVQAKTIDHGFQGVVKRWGMKGMPASHGVTKAHRKMGSTGGGGDKSGIWKGKKMPGHMGNRWSTLKGLKVWRINTKYNVLYVHGPCIPGNTHGMVRVYDSVLPHRRHVLEDHPPFPTWSREDSPDGIDMEYFDENLHRMSDPSIDYE